MKIKICCQILSTEIFKHLILKKKIELNYNHTFITMIYIFWFILGLLLRGKSYIIQSITFPSSSTSQSRNIIDKKMIQLMHMVSCMELSCLLV